VEYRQDEKQFEATESSGILSLLVERLCPLKSVAQLDAVNATDPNSVQYGMKLNFNLNFPQ